jgi:hypothetical protein
VPWSVRSAQAPQVYYAQQRRPIAMLKTNEQHAFTDGLRSGGMCVNWQRLYGVKIIASTSSKCGRLSCTVAHADSREWSVSIETTRRLSETGSAGRERVHVSGSGARSAVRGEVMNSKTCHGFGAAV